MLMLFIKKIFRTSKQQEQPQLFNQYFVTLFDIQKCRYIKQSDPLFMQKAYHLFHLNIQSQEIFRLAFQKDMKVINKVWPHWKKSDVTEITEFIKLSADKGIIKLVLQKWCLFIQTALKTFNTVSITNITNRRSSLIVQKRPLLYFHQELNIFCDILCDLVINMNQQFLQLSEIKATKILNSIKDLEINVKQKQRELIHNEIRVIIAERQQFSSVYQQLLNALQAEDAKPLKLENVQTPQHKKSFKEFMCQHYIIEDPQMKLQSCRFVKTQGQIAQFHAEKNIKEKLKKIKQIRKTIEDEISSIITNKKSQQPIIIELYSFLFQLFAPDIWKSMLYILVILDGSPQASITFQIDQIIDNRNYLHICSEESIQSFKIIIYGVRKMLSRC